MEICPYHFYTPLFSEIKIIHMNIYGSLENTLFRKRPEST